MGAIFSHVHKAPLYLPEPQGQAGQGDAPGIGNRKPGCFLHGPGGRPGPGRRGAGHGHGVGPDTLAGTCLATWHIVNYLQASHCDRPGT